MTTAAARTKTDSAKRAARSEKASITAVITGEVTKADRPVAAMQMPSARPPWEINHLEMRMEQDIMPPLCRCRAGIRIPPERREKYSAFWRTAGL